MACRFSLPLKVLAIQLKRIGDLVLTTPALHAMRAAGAHVTLALTDGTAALLPALGESADEPLIYRTSGGANSNLPVWKRLPRMNFDVCVDFTGRDRSAVMTLASRAPQRVVARPAFRKSQWRRWVYSVVADTSVRTRHTVDYYLDHAAALGLPTASSEHDPATPILSLPPEYTRQGFWFFRRQHDSSDDPYVVIHPGSARSEKYWVPKRWAEVIRHVVHERGRRCVLTGGPDPFETAHWDRIRAALGPDDTRACIDYTRGTDLVFLSAVLSRAALVVSVDTGPMHLAAAFRRPQIALFGPTNPFHWRPRHPGAVVLRSGHGDGPLTEFDPESPGGPTDAISTQAVIDCMKQVAL